MNNNGEVFLDVFNVFIFGNVVEIFKYDSESDLGYSLFMLILISLSDESEVFKRFSSGNGFVIDIDGDEFVVIEDVDFIRKNLLDKEMRNERFVFFLEYRDFSDF